MPAGGISQAIDRPSGLKSVTNPADATGGADPDTPTDARASAPLHVLTLERVVSLEDYHNYSTAFAGVAKAVATWTWFGRTRGVAVTVAGPGGEILDPAGETISNLATALRNAGNPYVPISVLPHQPQQFAIAALVSVDTTTYDPKLVLAAISASLLSAFGFTARSLGQGVAQSEVIAAMQSVSGVQGVKLNAFGPAGAPAASTLSNYLPAAAPIAGARGAVLLGRSTKMLLIDPTVPGQCTGAMASRGLDADQIYALLPAIHRTRDAAAGGPLRALIGVIAEQVGVLEQNLTDLYADQFIETCAAMR